MSLTENFSDHLHRRFTDYMLLSAWKTYIDLIAITLAKLYCFYNTFCCWSFGRLSSRPLDQESSALLVDHAPAWFFFMYIYIWKTDFVITYLGVDFLLQLVAWNGLMGVVVGSSMNLSPTCFTVAAQLTALLLEVHLHVVEFLFSLCERKNTKHAAARQSR